jgi:hypothetical protein
MLIPWHFSCAAAIGIAFSQALAAHSGAHTGTIKTARTVTSARITARKLFSRIRFLLAILSIRYATLLFFPSQPKPPTAQDN